MHPKAHGIQNLTSNFAVFSSISLSVFRCLIYFGPSALIARHTSKIIFDDVQISIPNKFAV